MLLNVILSRVRAIGLILVVALLPALPAAADPSAPTLRHNTNTIWFDNWFGLSDAKLKVAAPDGTVKTIREGTLTPTYRVSGSRILDGVYEYELRATTSEMIANTNRFPLTPGEDPPETVARQLSLSGVFLVENGRIKLTDTEQRRGE